MIDYLQTLHIANNVCVYFKFVGISLYARNDFLGLGTPIDGT